MIRLVILLLLYNLSVTQLYAQYHLDEFGIRGGGGLKDQPGFSINVHGYYSHYVCGKNWGYQFDLGTYNGFQGVRSSYIGQTADPFMGRFQSGIIDGGAYLKVRRKNYHRRIETCYLFGAKMFLFSYLQNFTLNPSYRNDPRYQPYLKYFEERNRLPLAPGAHVSAWFRFPASKHQSFFIIPGIEYYPGWAVGKKTEGNISYYSYSTLYAYINVGMTLWNNR